MNKIFIIARREFLSRVQKKTFLLTTILVPALIFGFYALIIYFSVKSEDNIKIAVVDKANLFGGKIENAGSDISFEFTNKDTALLRKDVESKKYSGYVFVPADYNVLGHDRLTYHSDKATGLMTQEKIRKKISSTIEDKRFLSLNISKAQLDSIQSDNDVQFTTFSGGDKPSRAGVSYAVGFVSGFLIYIILFIYGTMVMRGVMEEKVNRIAEVIVSSVKPFQLMMGKITGIGAVGLVQFLIWIVLMIGLQFLLPVIFPGMAEQMQSQPIQPGAVQAVNTAKSSGLLNSLAQVNFPLMLSCFLFYFLGGYLLYSSLFAAVGSSVNEDPQDAQSLTLPIIMPIIFAMVIMMKAVNDPTSGLAVFGSMFPLTSPIVMMARLAHGIPDGVTYSQLAISMILLIAGFIGTTWLAGKIYRTGILMYGKKITWKEMIKWISRKN
ncbi:ABC transporter permease [Foetidibacter luteolus]|uniref:ABC transporter permease n=1 Tax=Foetidibacter luteolus TaxID=2608880 RepID=UPI00129A7BDE|nr:ABC transporter permease [Foetidibacter luteolus]